MLDKQIVFNEIYDIFGKNLIDDGFQSNKNKNIYKYISNFGILIFDVKFTKGKVIHLNFSFSERSLELIFLEIENEYRVLQNLPKLDTRKITRPVISISDWSDLLVSNGYDYKEFNSWIEFIYAISDIKRIKPILKNIKELQDVESYLQTGILPNRYERKGLSASISSAISTPSPCANTVRAIKEGHIEKTIIQAVTSRKNNIHPTQKPVILLERLLKLVIPMKKTKIVIADWFAGSFSCGEAVINLQNEFPDKEFQFIGTEIDEEYFQNGKLRINNINYL